MAEIYSLHTDGGARGNPGPAGIGVVLEDSDGRVIEEIGKGIGWATNNVAEYEGLIEGLRSALRNGVRRLRVYMDSVLVIQQMRGAFKVKHPGLKPLHEAARDLARQFEEISFTAVPRDQNKKADKLMNEGVDRWLRENAGFSAPPAAEPKLF